MLKLYDDGHEIGVSVNLLTGMERIFFDQKEVCSGWSVGGKLHQFEVDIDGETVTYEVETALKWHLLGRTLTVRKNGKIILTDR